MRVKRKQFITEVGKLSYDFDFSLEKRYMVMYLWNIFKIII